MKISSKFVEALAEILIKIFQIIFAMLVVGMVLKDKFHPGIFVFGIVSSSIMLTVAIFLYYTATVK